MASADPAAVAQICATLVDMHMPLMGLLLQIFPTSHKLWAHHNQWPCVFGRP